MSRGRWSIARRSTDVATPRCVVSRGLFCLAFVCSLTLTLADGAGVARAPPLFSSTHLHPSTPASLTLRNNPETDESPQTTLIYYILSPLQESHGRRRLQTLHHFRPPDRQTIIKLFQIQK